METQQTRGLTTYPSSVVKTPNLDLLGSRVDFTQSKFDTILLQKGKPVIFEKAIQCPCKSSGTNQQSNCKNCGGTGWVFINPEETRMLIQSMSLATDYKAWSEELRGVVKVSALKEEKISFMDRITDLNASSYFNEVLHLVKKTPSIWFSYTSYKVKEVEYCALFQGVGVKLKLLTLNVDYTLSGNVFTLINNTLLDPNQDTSITIRYAHAPSFHVIEIQRESMESLSLENNTNEIIQSMPVTFMAKRAHYILDAQNLAKDRIIDNSIPIINNQCS